MGRWAQSRRRGGDAASPPPPPPAPLSVTVVNLTGGGVVVNFDGLVTFNGAPNDGSFSFFPANIAGIAQVGPTSIFFSLDITLNNGDPWSLSGQPAYVDEVVVFPEAGTIA
jgi:hypothetical protein